jgi:hypothetical protein
MFRSVCVFPNLLYSKASMMKGERKEAQKGENPEISFNNAYMYLSSSLSPPIYLSAGGGDTLVSSGVIAVWNSPTRTNASGSQPITHLKPPLEDHPR